MAMAVLALGIGALTAVAFQNGLDTLGLMGLVAVAVLIGSGAIISRSWSGDSPAYSAGTPKSASVPPDGHVRFTLVVGGLDPERIAAVWADLCRPDRAPSEELRLLFQNFTVVEGPRFRFLNGDPIATAALLTSLLRDVTGASVRTTLEPAAERTPHWS